MLSRARLFGVFVGALMLVAMSVQGQDVIELSWITELPDAEAIAAKFSETNPNITVRVDRVTFNEVFQQNQVRLGSQSPDPDIVSVDAPLATSYAYRGWLLPLDDLYTQEETDSWVDALYDSGKYQGVLYAPPIWNSTQLMYYNADLFEAAGITPPAVDERWTWEQVAEAAQALTQDTNNDGVVDVWGMQFAQYNRIYQLQPLAQGKGSPMISEDGLTVEGITNSQEFIDAYTWFANMHNEWAASPTGSIDAGELFRNGQLAIFIDGPWQIGQYVNEPLSFQGGAAPHPAWEGGEPMTPGDSWHVGVNAYTDHPEEAKAFVKFLTSEEIARYWYELWGVWPAHEVMLDELYASAEGAEFPESAYGVAAAEAPNTKPRPLTVGYLEYEQILSEAFEDIRNGADVTESLNLATERIQRELDKYKTQ